MKSKRSVIVVLAAFIVVFIVMVMAFPSDEPKESEKALSDVPKYAVQIYVDCESNLLFSRYDVDVNVDGEKIGTVGHGSEATFEVNLSKGQHELIFIKELDFEPDGKTSFVVEGDGDKFSYKIRCTSDQIEIESIEESAVEEPSAEATEDKADEVEPAEKSEATDDKPKTNTTQGNPTETKEPTTNNEVVVTEPVQETPQSKYEYACVRRAPSYDIYYLIDFDEMTATYFSTTDTPMVLPCSGDLNSGLIVDYVNDGFQERLQFKSPGDDSVVKLTDGNGFEWEYTKASVSEAEAALASVS